MKDQEKNSSKENKSSYKNSITFHSNLDTAAEEQAKYSAAQNPVERIRETVELIKRVYSYNPNKKRINKIIFDLP